MSLGLEETLPCPQVFTAQCWLHLPSNTHHVTQNHLKKLLHNSNALPEVLNFRYEIQTLRLHEFRIHYDIMIYCYRGHISEQDYIVSKPHCSVKRMVNKRVNYVQHMFFFPGAHYYGDLSLWMNGKVKHLAPPTKVTISESHLFVSWFETSLTDTPANPGKQVFFFSNLVCLMSEEHFVLFCKGWIVIKQNKGSLWLVVLFSKGMILSKPITITCQLMLVQYRAK